MFHNIPLSFHALANSKPTNGIEKETTDALRQDPEEEEGRIRKLQTYLAPFSRRGRRGRGTQLASKGGEGHKIPLRDGMLSAADCLPCPCLALILKFDPFRNECLLP